MNQIIKIKITIKTTNKSQKYLTLNTDYSLNYVIFYRKFLNSVTIDCVFEMNLLLNDLKHK